ncbi:MAG: hypothetical protein JWN13_2810, partial [Betaproteobacteria bacterium]|nr:hypothetical protein [Betaproteobacteria bacterium]
HGHVDPVRGLAKRLVRSVVDRFLDDVVGSDVRVYIPGRRCTGSMPRSFLTELSSYFFAAILFYGWARRPRWFVKTGHCTACRGGAASAVLFGFQAPQ